MIKIKRKGAEILTNKETDLKNQLARALADYDNLRKRTEKEKEEIVKLANLSFFLKLAPVIDSLKKAQDHLKDEGLENIIKELTRVLSEEGIESVEAQVGLRFDENYHEAVEVVNIEDETVQGTISEIILEGWKLKDGPVIRPAKVKVYNIKQ
jgi:molecular chaperone GrpE